MLKIISVVVEAQPADVTEAELGQIVTIVALEIDTRGAESPEVDISANDLSARGLAGTEDVPLSIAAD